MKTFSALTRLLLLTALLNGLSIPVSPFQESLTPEQYAADFDYLWSQLRAG